MSVLDRVKSIPPMVWLIGGAIVVALVVLTKSGGGSTGVSASGAGGGGDGTPGVDELESLSMGLSDLAASFEAANEDEAAWRAGIEKKLAEAAPANPNGDGHVKPATPKLPTRLGAAVKAKAGIRTSYNPSSLEKALKRAGVNPGQVISLAEIERALKNEHINYGATITKSDVAKLYRKTGVTPVAPKK